MSIQRTVTRGRGDRGQALPMIGVIVGVSMAVALLLTSMASRAVREARAQSAADAAALAEVVRPGSGRDLAVANGAVVTRQAVERDRVVVEVVRADASASAAAVVESIGLAPCHQYRTVHPLHFWLCRTTPTR